MFRCFVNRARYINRPILLQRTAGAKHQWNHDLIWGTSCCTRGVGFQEESSWTASINLLVPSTITRQISSSSTYLQQSHNRGQSESIKNVIQRNKRIVAFGKEGNWKTMLSLHAEDKEYFHIQNYATLVTFLARIRSVDTNHPLFREFLDDMVYRVVNDGTLQMSPRDISNIIYAFGKMNLKNTSSIKILDWLSNEDVADVFAKRSSAQAVSNVVWAYASLEEIDAVDLFEAIDKHSHRIFEEGTPQAVSNTIWGFAKLGFKPHGLLSYIENHADWLVENGNPQEVANSVWAFATLGMEAPNLFAHVEHHAKCLVEKGNPQAISNTAWACATLGIQAPNLFLHIEEQAEWLVRNGNPQNIANTAWAFAVVGYKSEELFKFLDLHLKKLSVKSNLQVQDVTNIIYAIAVLDFSKKHERLLLHLWTIACQMEPNSFQVEEMSQLVQVKLFAEAEGIKLPEFPSQLQKKMRKISVSDTQSRSQKQLSSCLTDLGFSHDVEVAPVDDCIIEGMLAIDMACKKGKIAIEFDGPHHFMKDIKTGDITGMENGTTKAKRRFLERRGWTVININYQDWMKVSKKSTQTKFLRKTLMKVGVEL